MPVLVCRSLVAFPVLNLLAILVVIMFPSLWVSQHHPYTPTPAQL
jgi:uncharacterized membrane protein affecting hemolysin expression